MKKLILYIIFFIASNMSSWGQVSIMIDSLILDNVIEAKDNDLIIHSWGNGPAVTISVSIINSSPQKIIIDQHDDYQLFCTYMYNKVSQKSMDIYLSISENSPLIIWPNSIYKETLTASLYLPSDIIEFTNAVIYDHSHVLDEVLSSFQMVFYYDGTKHMSNNNPIVLKGDHFYYEQEWKD